MKTTLRHLATASALAAGLLLGSSSAAQAAVVPATTAPSVSVSPTVGQATLTSIRLVGPFATFSQCETVRRGYVGAGWRTTPCLTPYWLQLTTGYGYLLPWPPLPTGYVFVAWR
ncbi:MAG TPA: hypothetical protein P5181_15550 [Dermatophilaceae bacterium]|nr:hypothetical protein [Dermatophilaceae bacterium]